MINDLTDLVNRDIFTLTAPSVDSSYEQLWALRAQINEVCGVPSSLFNRGPDG